MKRSLILILSLMFFLGFTVLSCSAKNSLFSDGASTSSSDDDDDEDEDEDATYSSSSQYDDEEEDDDDDNVSLGDEEELLTIPEAAQKKCKYFSDDIRETVHNQEIRIKDYTSDPAKYSVLNDDTISFAVGLICKTTDGKVHDNMTDDTYIGDCSYSDFPSSVVRYDVTFIFTVTGITGSSDCDDITHTLQIGQQRQNDGCFDPETRIRSIENREVPIKLLNKGDKVFNPLNKKFMEIEKLVIGPEELPMVEVQVAGKVVKVSSTHAFITKKGPKMAMDVNLNDEIALEDGKTMHPVERVSLVLPVDKKQQVYNIKLKSNSKDPKEHAVLANGVVSGDLFLQSELEKKAGKPVKADKKEVKKDVKADKKDLKKEEVKEVKKEEVKK